MPKISQTKKFILEFGKNIFPIKSTILFCKIFQVKANCETRFTQHVKKSSTKSDEGITTVFVFKYFQKCEFSKDLCNSMMCDNITLNTISVIPKKIYLLRYSMWIYFKKNVFEWMLR